MYENQGLHDEHQASLGQLPLALGGPTAVQHQGIGSSEKISHPSPFPWHALMEAVTPFLPTLLRREIVRVQA